ncbi:F-box protein At5g62510-like [Lycium ferocissimum]|uniref:F-box protein At5g62510-like n=1 Tax=Lycium ferocissimum TaxID=112874 RepID=UPI002815A980|nr:F-box protein At5g62510-like [Lycium ferocissimum]
MKSDNINSGRGQRLHHKLFGLAFQVASAIALKTINALDNASANPARKVDNTASCEDLINSSNDAMERHFPEEIIMDILIRLPVRALLRFRCVSKFWKTLISTTEFKMKHLNHAKNNQNSQKYLISRRCPKDNSMLYYSSSLSLVQPVEDALGFPSNHRPCQYLILCCCDSLALLWVQGKHLLWNPSTNESVVLPNPNPEFSPS